MTQNQLRDLVETGAVRPTLDEIQEKITGDIENIFSYEGED